MKNINTVVHTVFIFSKLTFKVYNWLSILKVLTYLNKQRMPSSVLLHAYLKNNVENEMLSRSGWQKTAGKQVFITVILPPDYRHSSWQDLLYQINVFKHCTGSWKEKWQSTMKNSRLRFKPKMNWKDKKFKLSTDICTTRLINIRNILRIQNQLLNLFLWLPHILQVILDLHLQAAQDKKLHRN